MPSSWTPRWTSRRPCPGTSDRSVQSVLTFSKEIYLHFLVVSRVFLKLLQAQSLDGAYGGHHDRHPKQQALSFFNVKYNGNCDGKNIKLNFLLLLKVKLTCFWNQSILLWSSSICEWNMSSYRCILMSKTNIFSLDFFF